jgi:hypothetical protein
MGSRHNEDALLLQPLEKDLALRNWLATLLLKSFTDVRENIG